MKESIKTQGILLKRTWLANDDAVLDIFTRDLGRVTVFASKLARSKKRQLELDFFRLLDLELLETRTAYKLSSVSTVLWLGQLQSSFTLSEQVFEALDGFRQILPEEKSLPVFFELSLSVLKTLKSHNAALLLVFWEIKALIASGVCPRFDELRQDVWWQAESFEIFATEAPHSIFVPNLVRQLLEFLRRSDLVLVLEKQEALPQQIIEQALERVQFSASHH